MKVFLNTENVKSSLAHKIFACAFFVCEGVNADQLFVVGYFETEKYIIGLE